MRRSTLTALNYRRVSRSYIISASLRSAAGHPNAATQMRKLERLRCTKLQQFSPMLLHRPHQRGLQTSIIALVQQTANNVAQIVNDVVNLKAAVMPISQLGK